MGKFLELYIMKLNGFWRLQLVTCWIFPSCRLFVTVNKMENTIKSISQLQQQIYGTEIPALQYIQQIFKVCIYWPNGTCGQFPTIHVINENDISSSHLCPTIISREEMLFSTGFRKWVTRVWCSHFTFLLYLHWTPK